MALPEILADQLTLFQPGGTDYAYLITAGTPEFSDLPTALLIKDKVMILKDLIKILMMLIIVSMNCQMNLRKERA